MRRVFDLVRFDRVTQPAPPLFTVAALLLGLACCNAVNAETPGGRVLATGGVTQLEGAAGAGLAPWAVIAGYGTRDEIGVNGFYTYVDTGHFRLQGFGAAIGLYDRLELSFARQNFDLGDTVPGESIDQNILGLKLKLFGDAVFGQDSLWPQVALGVQYKRNLDYSLVPRLLGAEDSEGVDVYLAATKLYLGPVFGRNLLLNAAVRGTRANQFGLLGFGGDRDDDYSAQFEGSAGVFLNDRTVIGVEYRTKPDNLSVFEEEDAADVFFAFLPNKYLALTAAYAHLGRIADQSNEQALYLSAQLSF